MYLAVSSAGAEAWATATKMGRPRARGDKMKLKPDPNPEPGQSDGSETLLPKIRRKYSRSWIVGFFCMIKYSRWSTVNEGALHHMVMSGRISTCPPLPYQHSWTPPLIATLLQSCRAPFLRGNLVTQTTKSLRLKVSNFSNSVDRFSSLAWIAYMCLYTRTADVPGRQVSTQIGQKKSCPLKILLKNPCWQKLTRIWWRSAMQGRRRNFFKLVSLSIR